MLPKSNEDKVFYKRPSNYNFTIHNLKTKQCYCFLWHEGLGIEEVILFGDGCPGQNKNSVVASMLLHTVCSLKNIKCISLSFFVPCHEQNEADSAHRVLSPVLRIKLLISWYHLS
nr:unnamed protein product [Callosobruchus analis]